MHLPIPHSVRDDVGAAVRQKIALQYPQADASVPMPPQCSLPVFIHGQKWLTTVACTRGPAFGGRWHWAATASYPAGVLGRPQDTHLWSRRRLTIAQMVCRELLRGAGEEELTKTVLLPQGLLMLRPMRQDERRATGNDQPVGLQVGG